MTSKGAASRGFCTTPRDGSSCHSEQIVAREGVLSPTRMKQELCQQLASKSDFLMYVSVASPSTDSPCNVYNSLTISNQGASHHHCQGTPNSHVADHLATHANDDDGSSCMAPSRLPHHNITVLEASTSGRSDCILGLPYCVAELVMQSLDSQGKRVLRSVNRKLYFEASQRITRLEVQPDSLETLILMPLHQVMPCLQALVHRFGTQHLEPSQVLVLRFGTQHLEPSQVLVLRFGTQHLEPSQVLVLRFGTQHLEPSQVLVLRFGTQHLEPSQVLVLRFGTQHLEPSQQAKAQSGLSIDCNQSLNTL
ncbi:hypothetical protein CEUSTIGMA_g10270.t1 [Chlamydomonas eustigma]|uniref:Uncharacterized protein n=1 Tax=Chlamydomonas eustigma TaxID=1157962 RepID=A0A250XID7_9CHLO|nr:hypothetical protein CEUSTIGMA_g10270.t1 [Chlamydomonas eustigma]|eukprot:GAX82844.1 hypothetical protein CEUSTIGMA_g10270.t1 [Chlamydomonas eustigma]